MHGVMEYDMRNIRGPLANSFVLLINALFFNMKLIGPPDVYPKDYSSCLLRGKQDTFDFIIVGASTAGCSLANRLTENERWSVLLIEAGDYPSPTTEVPSLYPTLMGTDEDWNFRLEQDDNACGSYYQSRCTLSRGKVLGGTSTINNLLYQRGLTEDYDRLAFDSWGSNSTYAILEQLENYRGTEEFNINYGTDGNIKLELANYDGPPKQFLRQAYKDVGLASMSKRHTLGFSDFLTTIRGGERTNMAKNFLTPVKDRPNLFFSKQTEAIGIIIGEVHDQRATGVNVTIKNRKLSLIARKEVILTAGAINNAKLLLLSGVGPRKYMNEKKIPLAVDIPAVGKNLQFHLTVPLFVAYQPEGSTCNRDYYSDSEAIKATYDYIMHRTGDLSHTNINNFVVLISTKLAGLTVPNMAIYHQYYKIDSRQLMTWVDAKNYHVRIKTNLIRKNKEKAIIMFNIHLIRPLSRGEVLLNDTHYLGNPKIVPKFMSDEDNQDYENLLSGFDFITNMTDMFKERTEFLDLDIPNCRNYKFCTMAYVRCYIYNMATPNSDAVGTTLMGAECEGCAVVKENLELRSVRCLRVADSSVLNFIPTGNTIATDAMFGFKMAEILKEKWENDYHSQYIIERPNEPV